MQKEEAGNKSAQILDHLKDRQDVHDGDWKSSVETKLLMIQLSKVAIAQILRVD